MLPPQPREACLQMTVFFLSQPPQQVTGTERAFHHHVAGLLYPNPSS